LISVKGEGQERSCCLQDGEVLGREERAPCSMQGTADRRREERELEGRGVIYTFIWNEGRESAFRKK
jgi:hypothetical protein